MQADILKANYNDLAAILKLQKECYKIEAEIYSDYDIPPLQQDLSSLELEFKNTVILKCVINGQIVGSVRALTDNSTCHIGKLIVNLDFQNQGIGRLLMDSIESIHSNCDRFELFTGYKSQKNLYLYNRLGYIEFTQKKINDNLTMIYLEKKNIKTPSANK